MQIKVSCDSENVTAVEVIDPSDGAETHFALVEAGQQIIVTATSARSPADIDFGEVEAIPTPHDEEQRERESEGPSQRPPLAEGAEEPADSDETPPAAA